MTLAEFFELYSISYVQQKRWTRMIAGYEWSDLCAGLERAVKRSTTTTTPTLHQIRVEIAQARTDRMREEKRAERTSHGVAEENSAEELSLMDLVRGLNERGVWWCFSRLRWIAGEQDRQEYRWTGADSHHNRESTLAEARAAWAEYGAGEPEPAFLRPDDGHLIVWSEKVPDDERNPQ